VVTVSQFALNVWMEAKEIAAQPPAPLVASQDVEEPQVFMRAAIDNPIDAAEPTPAEQALLKRFQERERTQTLCPLTVR